MAVIAVNEPEDPLIDVVFLHGLDGDAHDTWSGDDGPGWPQWLGEDIPVAGVWTVGYAAASKRWKRGRALPIVQRASNLLADLQNKGIGERPVCLVTHSMGGLVAKEMVLQSKDGAVNSGFADAVKGVVFLATPHQGAHLATLVDRFRRAFRATPAIKDLMRYSPHLADAAFRYRTWVEESDTKHLAFFETYKTKNAAIVVDQGSADPGLTGVKPIPVEADHLQICKPVDRDSLVFGQVERFVRELIASDAPAPRTGPATSGARTPNEIREASAQARSDLRPDILPAIRRSQLVADLGQRRFPQVILGEGGLGKSVLAGQVFDHYEATRPTLLALCTRIPGNTPIDTPDALDSALGVLLDPGAPGLTDVVTRFAERPVLVLDTVDLLLREETVDAIVTLLGRLATMADIVVTCREREWQDLIPTSAAYETWRLPHLDHDAVIEWTSEFTATLNTPTDVLHDSLVVALDKRRGLDVLGVPLRLAMVCRLYALDGKLPEDLTVSRLYQDYWESRVRRDRRGRETQESLRVEDAALRIAERIWAASDSRFVEDVPTLDPEHNTPRRQLLSEGVLKETGLRASFFHQTFAEFAVAKHLAHRADPVDWARLSDGLRTGRSGYWGLTTHLVAEPMTSDRAQPVFAAIPRNTVEGVRLLLKASFAHADDPEALVVIEELFDTDSTLVVAASDTLADAPRPLHHTVMSGIVRLTATSDTGITGLVRAGADLVRLARPDDDETFLDALLDALLAREDDKTPDMSPDFQRLISRVLETPISISTRDRLLSIAIAKYQALPRSGRAGVLKHAAGLEVGSPLNRTLTDIAIRYELPEQGADDAAVLLARDWHDPAIRKARGWATWWEVLASPLPTRWDSALVRVFAHIAHDITGVLDPLIEETVRPTRDSLPRRDRLNNASKYAAEQAPERTLEIMLRSPFGTTGNAISSASQLARHIESHLTGAQRVQMIHALVAGANHDPGKAWPSIVKLATADDSLLSHTVDELESRIRASPSDSWQGTLHKSLDGLIQAATSQQMLDLETRIAALGRLVGGIDGTRSARIAASIAPLTSSARQAVDLLIDRRTGEVDNAAITELAGRINQWPPGVWESTGLPWTLELLRTRNQTAVGVVASMLRPYCVSLLWDDRYTDKVTARLLEAIDGDEDSQVAQHLMQVCADLVHHEPRPRGSLTLGLRADVVESVLDAYLTALKRGETEPDGGRARRQIAAVYSCLGDAMTDVAKKILDEEAFGRRVLAITSDIDTGPIGGQASRGLAALLRSAVRTYPRLWAGLETAWLDLSESNQRAVAECALLGRVTNGRSVALQLVRQGCHPSVAAYVHRMVGD
ncbi:MAG: alpha/beta fold hydrolase [Nocardioides sp.]